MVSQIYDVRIVFALLLMVYMARFSQERFRYLRAWIWISEEELKELEED